MSANEYCFVTEFLNKMLAEDEFIPEEPECIFEPSVQKPEVEYKVVDGNHIVAVFRGGRVIFSKSTGSLVNNVRRNFSNVPKELQNYYIIVKLDCYPWNEICLMYKELGEAMYDLSALPKELRRKDNYNNYLTAFDVMCKRALKQKG